MGAVAAEVSVLKEVIGSSAKIDTLASHRSRDPSIVTGEEAEYMDTDVGRWRVVVMAAMETF